MEHRLNDCEFDAFVSSVGVSLKRALVSRLGTEQGAEAHAAAMAYAWEYWGRISAMANPAGYLYRVAQSSLRADRRYRDRRSALVLEIPCEDATLIELVDLLNRLSPAQRQAVLLVNGYGWSYGEAAEVIGCSTAAIRNHVHRGMKRLRLEYTHGN